MAMPAHRSLLATADAALNEMLWDDLLCIADSKLVLGHWYWKVLPNGRELTDFVALASMTQDELGHTRALFGLLEGGEKRRWDLEARVGPHEIRSMEALDDSPRSWGDFVATVWLADAAIWSSLSAYENAAAAPLAGLVEKIGREEYYHRLCTEGWVRATAVRPDDRGDLESALSRRYAAVLRWFGPDEALPLDSLRTTALRAKGDEFIGYVQGMADDLQLTIPRAADGGDGDWEWARRRERGSSIGKGLYAILSSADPKLKELENVTAR